MSLYDLYRQLTLSRKIFLLFLAAVLLRIYLEYDSSQESFRSSVKDNNCSLDIYRDLKSRHSITEQSLNASKDESAVYQRKKIFLLVVLCIYQGYEIQVIKHKSTTTTAPSSSDYTPLIPVKLKVLFTTKRNFFLLFSIGNN